MGERRKLILAIAASLAGLLSLSTILFAPLAKDNAARRKELSKLKQEVQMVEKFSRDKLDLLEKKADKVISDLESKFPPGGKLKLAEQITRTPEEAKIVFSKISHKEPQGHEGFQSFPVEVEMQASFQDVMAYLKKLTQPEPLFIGIGNLSLRKVSPEKETLDIRIKFLGFRLTHKVSSMSKYVQEKFTPLDISRLEKLLEPVQSVAQKKAYPILSSYSPFGYVKEPTVEIVQPEEIDTDMLSLKGIMRVGEEKAALINDQLFKKGEMVEGLQVLEIQDEQVILMHQDKRYILRMGVSDELTEPKP